MKCACVEQGVYQCGPGGAGPEEPSVERESATDPGAVIVSDSVHVMDRMNGVCVAAIVTGLTATPWVLDLTAWPRGGGNYPVNMALFNPHGELPDTWHHPEACPQPHRPAGAAPGLVLLLPLLIPARAVRWEGDNLQQVRKITGTRENGDYRFLTPGDICGSWRHPHVYNDARQMWEPVKIGDWIVAGHQQEWTVVPGHVVAAAYEPVPT